MKEMSHDVLLKQLRRDWYSKSQTEHIGNLQCWKHCIRAIYLTSREKYLISS